MPESGNRALNPLLRAREAIKSGANSHRVCHQIRDTLRDQAETSVLFELISERYERKSLAITANTPFSQWGEVFVEPAMTLAAVDRLVHHSTILEMNVESYRRRAAQAGHAPPVRKARSTT